MVFNEPSDLTSDNVLDTEIETSFQLNHGPGDARIERKQFTSSTWTVVDTIRQLSFRYNGLGSAETVSLGTDFGDPSEFTVEFLIQVFSLNVDGNNNYRDLVYAGENFISVEETGEITLDLPGTLTSSFSAGDISDGGIYRVSCVYDGIDRIIYLTPQGGVTSEAGRTSTSGTPAFEPLDIGSQTSDHNPNARIDDVRFWSDARTQTEIEDNAFIKLDGTESNLLGYYEFDAADGDTTATDSAGANDGTIDASIGRGPPLMRSTYTHTGLVDGTSYDFRVVAQQSGDELADIDVETGERYGIESGQTYEFEDRLDVQGRVEKEGSVDIRRTI